jgi:hypothetical protein
MSILSFKPIGTRSLAKMYEYMIDSAKTNVNLIFALGTNPRYVIEEMQFAQQMFCKIAGNDYKQVVLSFDRDISLSFSIIKEIAEQIGRCLFAEEYQVFGAIHLDTENIHVHYLINSVNVSNGGRFRQSKSVYWYKREVNKILNLYGLNSIYYYEGIDGVVEPLSEVAILKIMLLCIWHSGII